MTDSWQILPFTRADKRIIVTGIDQGVEIYFEVDFDDVDHEAVEAGVARMVETLNLYGMRPPDWSPGWGCASAP